MRTWIFNISINQTDNVKKWTRQGILGYTKSWHDLEGCQRKPAFHSVNGVKKVNPNCSFQAVCSSYDSYFNRRSAVMVVLESEIIHVPVTMEVKTKTWIKNA